MNIFESENDNGTDDINDHGIWAEKYRPKTLDSYVCDDSFKKVIDSYISQKQIPHLLLYGNAGTGKTTLAKILANSIDADVMYVNASDNNGIDFIRDKIRPFAASNGFTDFKIIILDECLGEDTSVWVLRNGTEQSIKIKDVDDKQDLVKSFNIKTSNIEWRPFILWDKGEQECVKMELDNGEVVVCTYDHKWYVYDDNMKIIKMKMVDIIKNNIDYILSPV
jgi:DNA polymerase III delta prime subunit